MIKNSVADYDVVDTEMVKIEVEGKFNLVTFAVDGAEIPRDPHLTTPTFTFPVTKQSGETHFCEVVCDFPPNAINTDKYQVFATGNKNPDKNVRHTGPTIRKSSTDWTRDMTFNVT